MSFGLLMRFPQRRHGGRRSAAVPRLPGRVPDFPGRAKLDAVVTDTVYPNGLAFTPDESVLYVNDTRLGEIRAYDMRPDGSCGPKRLFHKLAGSEPGIADGMKVDREGNVYCTGPGGIHVIGPDGKLLGRIRIPDHCTNMAWGDTDWRSPLHHDLWLGVPHPRERTGRPGLVGGVN